MNPELLDRYRYVRQTPTWFVRVFYVLGILTWIPILWTAFTFANRDLFFEIFVIPLTVIFTVHYLSSFLLALCYKQFDLQKHQRRIAWYWETHAEPSVDVYLPICGEDLEVLKHTWLYVSRLKYKNRKVYVLDDSKEECEEHRKLAEQFGFTYFERPNKGEMKKAGNLKYAFARTEGEFIAILDADFAVHPEYLHELIPYMADRRIGIVQSPQYFPTTSDIHAEGPLAYGGARAQEVFYRIIQVARDRLGGAHCCGTCAIYRRAALSSIGGFVQMGHSEDAHTGFGLTSAGWIIRYVPILVSIGASPDNAHAFFHQQHRWCLGNILMMLDKKFWRAPIPWRIKYCYITGYLFYMQQPFLLLFSLQLFWILFFYNSSISLAAGIPFYPHIIWALVFMITFYLAPFRWGYLYAILMRSFAYCHAMASVILRHSVGWIPTNSKHRGVSAAFQQTLKGVAGYVGLNILLIIIAAWSGALHFFNINYFSIQFWIFYNCALSSMVLWQLIKTSHHASAPSPSALGLRMLNLKMFGSAALVVLLLGAGVEHSLMTRNHALADVRVPASKNSNKIAAISFLFTVDHYPSERAPGIRYLQEFLNQCGFPVAQSGPGSVGQETTYFGPATEHALMEFKKIEGLPSTPYLDKPSRNYINALLSS